MKHEGCHHLLAELSDYLDGEASDKMRAEIEEHMARCGKCRVVVDTLRKTVTLYRQLPQPDLPSQAMEKIYKVLDVSGIIRTAPTPDRKE